MPEDFSFSEKNPLQKLQKLTWRPRALSLIKIHHISKSNERLPLNQLYIEIKIVPVVYDFLLNCQKIERKKFRQG